MPGFRTLVRHVWGELHALPRPRRFVNSEGGSVEQQHDRRLILHHCANYAATLGLFLAQGRRLRLLELGCGSGALSCAFARAMPPDWELVATDYSPELLAQARTLYRLPNLSFEWLDARELVPGRLTGFDGVFFLEVIEHLPSAEAVKLLARLHAAMRPGGVLVFTTLDRAAFPRPFSGYAPHFAEYSYRSMRDFLRGSPFEQFDVHRLISERIAQEHVRAENTIGYAANRLRRLAGSLVNRLPVVEGTVNRAVSLGFRLYSLLPGNRRFDLDGYLGTLEFATEDKERRDRESFGLVAWLKKAEG